MGCVSSVCPLDVSRRSEVVCFSVFMSIVSPYSSSPSWMVGWLVGGGWVGLCILPFFLTPKKR